MSNKETAQEVFDSGVENGDSRDTIVVSMVQAGCSLNGAQNFYKEMANEAGISSARIGHKAEALEYIEDSNLDIADDEDRADLKKELQAKFNVAASTSNDYVKAYAKANDIELPSAGFGANPEDQAKIFNWIVKNPDCDKTEFKAFMEEVMGRSSGSIDETWRGIKLARQLAAEGVEFEDAD